MIEIENEEQAIIIDDTLSVTLGIEDILCCALIKYETWIDGTLSLCRTGK